MLYFIGLGLNDARDITVKGLEAVKSCKYIYLENYTSILESSKEELEEFYQKEVILADRDLVEKQADEILIRSEEEDVAFLVVGDIFGATTHTDLMMRAKEKNIKTKFIHNASILTAVGIVGLELYKYGKTTSIPFNNENVDTPIKVFNKNKEHNLHTLFLLDLDPKNNNFLTINDAADYLIKKGVNKELIAIGCAKIGNEHQEIKVTTLENLTKENFTKYPQCLIIPGDLHFMEEDALELWK
jgi:diphthine methyl ester synthase